ncbi:MAG: hypothetical protein ACI84D_002616 [Thalassolituus oleivorans]|jgi:hypothetical protein
MFPDEFQFEGNRALILTLGADPSNDAVTICVATALTDHLSKSKARSAVRSSLR